MQCNTTSVQPQAALFLSVSGLKMRGASSSTVHFKHAVGCIFLLLANLYMCAAETCIQTWCLDNGDITSTPSGTFTI